MKKSLIQILIQVFHHTMTLLTKDNSKFSLYCIKEIMPPIALFICKLFICLVTGCPWRHGFSSINSICITVIVK